MQSPFLLFCRLNDDSLAFTTAMLMKSKETKRLLRIYTPPFASLTCLFSLNSPEKKKRKDITKSKQTRHDGSVH
ncbi:hypothetical protein BC940DRAFT_310564 [Gongronella butleri]|nr:hypothetical protein BC940DRAFT_310564 [Gongronella butleri]